MKILTLFCPPAIASSTSLHECFVVDFVLFLIQTFALGSLLISMGFLESKKVFLSYGDQNNRINTNLCVQFQNHDELFGVSFELF